MNVRYQLCCGGACHHFPPGKSSFLLESRHSLLWGMASEEGADLLAHLLNFGTGADAGCVSCRSPLRGLLASASDGSHVLEEAHVAGNTASGLTSSSITHIFGQQLGRPSPAGNKQQPNKFTASCISALFCSPLFSFTLKDGTELSQLWQER